MQLAGPLPADRGRRGSERRADRGSARRRSRATSSPTSGSSRTRCGDATSTEPRTRPAARGSPRSGRRSARRTPRRRSRVSTSSACVLTLEARGVPGPADRRRDLQGTLAATTYGRTPASLREPTGSRALSPAPSSSQLDGDAYRIVTSEGGLALGSTGVEPASGQRSAGRRSPTSHARSGSTSARARSDSGTHRHAGDDGRRALLARLRLRRVARPLRRQLIRRRRHRPVGDAGGLPPERRSSAMCRGGSSTCQHRPAPTSPSAETVASRPTSTCDGHTDLYVTSAGYNVSTDAWDALLWNDGDGTFTEGAVQAGSTRGLALGRRGRRRRTATGGPTSSSPATRIRTSSSIPAPPGSRPTTWRFATSCT